MTPSPNQSQVAAALVSFLRGILPGVEIIAGQDNRVPEPVGPDFVVFWPIRRRRIATNLDLYVDAVFTGNVSGTTLNIDFLLAGSLLVGSPVTGAGGRRRHGGHRLRDRERRGG
jgi:hypothetical protein